MNKVNTLCAAALLFLSSASIAQVQFKLSYSQETERYMISVVPQQTYAAPQNITGTGQVTIKVPTNNFDPVDIESMLTGMLWEANARNNSPSESPDFDYISFGLNIQGIAFPDYVAGVELPLFSFQNAYGCNGAITLVDNFADEFMPPNSQNANIGNALTILGAGGEAYGGISGSAVVNCDPNAVLSAKEEIGLGGYTIFPNPASDYVNVKVDWNGDATDANILIVDATGKQVMTAPASLATGKNTQKVKVSELAPGSYWVYLAGNDWKVGLDRFSKQ
ncbi:MAG: T9SS type A sorting domain-containing protein [Saprospiraceae bacterium]|nr:T9SS type A sorting domain-containing protein [Saprospiraceae bacterium]MCF8249198.1 T9SS type A sorting domain-containing protein [Saprospiraceae bacterium]MCF8280195.1 T9SS type A sorting domain-containing protein [Bacteroidales bacterium]MCF8311327.1 T9SS type A sorting domain-containing protein [Saprospiraceae bacterium]MCF8440109.1 T9SS type A sorting domain-containing protein [Saprospiraceae bacterium]